jgi:hypothetical protein
LDLRETKQQVAEEINIMMSFIIFTIHQLIIIRQSNLGTAVGWNVEQERREEK